MNPETKEVLDGLSEEVNVFRQVVEKRDVEAFADSFRLSAEHYAIKTFSLHTTYMTR